MMQQDFTVRRHRSSVVHSPLPLAVLISHLLSAVCHRRHSSPLSFVVHHPLPSLFVVHRPLSLPSIVYCRHHPSQLPFIIVLPNIRQFPSDVHVHPFGPFRPPTSVYCHSSLLMCHILQIVCIVYIRINTVFFKSYVHINSFLKNLYLILKNTYIYIFLYLYIYMFIFVLIRISTLFLY